jgi:chromosome partitioning protein
MSIPIFDIDKPKVKGNKILAFANQKGGVGKSTLSVMFSDFLADLGDRFVCFDADPQQSIVKKRRQEREEHPDIEIPYQVVSYLDLHSEEKTLSLVANMRNEDFDFVIDTPGSLSLQGSLALLANCDAIIIPFSYENTCVNSTNPFLSVVANTCKMSNREVPPLFFLPNQINRRWGNKKELEERERLNELYGSMGTVLPMVPSGVEMQRYSSLYITPRQLEIVRPCFTALREGIYGDSKKVAI